ncbi:methyl-accepting chemotaxis protein [Paraburkholderia ferrariae]|uniref:methyl-accepting chemotaxis protein n=1 Tax=Paraburkholderia ferrariae TaxID=386056 RepID=UPI000484B595|nr:methyl-accepting chemotaxis protein [Paraburkholderia ferrariae]
MTIRLRLRILVIAALIAASLGIIVPFVGFKGVSDAGANTNRHELQIRGLTEIKASALSTIELDPTSADTRLIFADAEQNIEKWGKTIAPLFRSADQQRDLASLLSHWSAYDQKSRQLIELATHDPKSANDQIVKLYHGEFHQIQAGVDAMIATASERGNEARENAERINRGAVRSVAVVLVLVVLVVVPWIIVLSRTIQRSLGNMQVILQEANDSHDLTKRIPADGRDEVSQTARAFNQLMDRVSGAMLIVKTSAESVASTSKQIAVGNLDLSARTEEQAASLEQTAASMEELTSTVQQNATNALHAQSLSTNASESVARGNEVVSNMIDTMNEINGSSTRIAEIIGLIEGISFQTNILALNAAVEAARAGEQGRGFAVVAGEVRALAQRSASAAKDVKNLIGKSVEQVDTGTKLVNQVGGAMLEIRSTVSRVAEMMSEIGAASGEQSRGIEQIRQAVTQLNEVTQQNAALVEESAASAQFLDDQANSLRGAINIFKLDTGGFKPAMPET